MPRHSKETENQRVEEGVEIIFNPLKNDRENKAAHREGESVEIFLQKYSGSNTI